jgi:hypothetical protein
MKYASMVVKPSRVTGGVLLVGEDALLGRAFSALEKREVGPVRRVFFLDEKGVHECSRDPKLTEEELLKTAVLVDCNVLHLAAALRELGDPVDVALAEELEKRAAAEQAKKAADLAEAAAKKAAEAAAEAKAAADKLAGKS